MKLRYKRSVLGIVWSMLNPLLQLLVFYFVFGLLLPLNIPHYASFLFTGVLAVGGAPPFQVSTSERRGV